MIVNDRYSNGEVMSGDTFYTVTDQEDGKRQDATGRVTILPRKADQGKKHVCYVHNPATINPLWVKTYLEVLCKYYVHNPATMNHPFGTEYVQSILKGLHVSWLVFNFDLNLKKVYCIY